MIRFLARQPPITGRNGWSLHASLDTVSHTSATARHLAITSVKTGSKNTLPADDLLVAVVVVVVAAVDLPCC